VRYRSENRQLLHRRKVPANETTSLVTCSDSDKIKQLPTLQAVNYREIIKSVVRVEKKERGGRVELLKAVVLGDALLLGVEVIQLGLGQPDFVEQAVDVGQNGREVGGGFESLFVLTGQEVSTV